MAVDSLRRNKGLKADTRITKKKKINVHIFWSGSCGVHGVWSGGGSGALDGAEFPFNLDEKGKTSSYSMCPKPKTKLGLAMDKYATNRKCVRRTYESLH